MFSKISLLIALIITTNVLSQPLSNEGETMASLEASGNDTKSKRQIQFIDFMSDHNAPFKLLSNYEPYDAFIYSNDEQNSGDNIATNVKCTQCNPCSQRQNNARNSQEIRTVSPSNIERQNTPSNSIVNRWLLMYVPNPFVAVPHTFSAQAIKPVVNATRVNSVLLSGTTSTNSQTEHTQATGKSNKAVCSVRRRCKCCGRTSKKPKQENSDNRKGLNKNEFENTLKSDEIDESGELLTRSNLEDKLLMTDITATGSTANKEKATTNPFKNCNSSRKKQTTALEKIATDLTEISETNTTATKTDVNALKSLARNTTKSHSGDTILSSIKDSSLDAEENDFKRENNFKTFANKTQTDLQHHLSKSENNSVTNILIIQKTISTQNGKSIESNHTSESSTCVHQLQRNDALLHTSIKDSLSNSSITVLFSNHDNNKPLTREQQFSKSHVPTPIAGIRRQGSNNTNLLYQPHNKDTHVEGILSETDAVNFPEVETSSPLSVYLHKIEESRSQPKNVVKESWKIVKPQPKRQNFSNEDCV